MPPACKNLSELKREGGKACIKHFLLKPAPFLARALIIFIGSTLRIETAGGENLEKALAQKGNVIFAFWHNMLLPMTYLLREKGICVMVSRSRDGEIISRTVSFFGAEPVRGSTGKRGGEALRKMIRRIEKGANAAITPDGPQGPIYRAQPGAAYIAAMTTRPLVPAAFSSARKVRLKTWDGFMVPFPFSRAVMAYGRPVYVSNDDNLEEKRLEIEERLNEAMKAAEESISRYKSTGENYGHTVS